MFFWKDKDFIDYRGKSTFTAEQKQIIYDEWKCPENAIDRRNGRDKVKIRKILHLKKFNDCLKNVEPEVEELQIKGGLLIMQHNLWFQLAHMQICSRN